MLFEEKQNVKVTYFDGSSYSGKIYKLAVQICEDDHNNPHTLMFISQDMRFADKEGEFGCAALWVDKIKTIQPIPQ